MGYYWHVYIVNGCYHGLFANPKQLSMITEQDHVLLLHAPSQRALMATAKGFFHMHMCMYQCIICNGPIFFDSPRVGVVHRENDSKPVASDY